MTDRRMVHRNIYESSVCWTLSTKFPKYEGLKAQRVFEALIFLADDYGNGRFIPSMIRNKAFSSLPDVLMDVSDDDIIKWVETIQSVEKAVLIYEVNNQKYFTLTGWQHYQRGNWRPAETNIPFPPKEVFIKYSLSMPEVFNSKQVKCGLSKPKVAGIEEKRREEKRKEKKKEPLISHGDIVKLSKSEYDKLLIDFGEPTLKNKIMVMNEYCAINGKTYKDYNLALRKWFRDEGINPKGENNSQSTEEYIYDCPKGCDGNPQFTAKDFSKPCPICGAKIMKFQR